MKLAPGKVLPEISGIDSTFDFESVFRLLHVQKPYTTATFSDHPTFCYVTLHGVRNHSLSNFSIGAREMA